jgi:hypothetical protein
MESEAKLIGKIFSSVEVKSIEGFIPDSRSYSICVKVDDEDVFIHGGSNQKKEYFQIDMFDLLSFQWRAITEISTVNPFFIFDKTLSGHTANLIFHEGDKKILVYGGFDGKTYSNSLYLIETDNYSFNQIDVRGKSEYPQPRCYHTSSYDEKNNCIFIFGGWNGNLNSLFSHNFAALWKFDLKSKKNIKI